MLLVSFAIPTYAQTPLQVGDNAPLFTGTTDEGTAWTLKDHLENQYLVVYFYPAAMTGGCTAQACTYRDSQGDLREAGAMVVGISGDNAEGLKLFRKAHDLNFTLLADEEGSIAEKFGVPTREGGTISRELGGTFYDLYRGVTASRWTFIISPEGKIVYKNEDVNASSDTEQVLTFIKKHKASR